MNPRITIFKGMKITKFKNEVIKIPVKRKSFIQKVSNEFCLSSDDSTNYFSKKELFKLKIRLYNESDAFVYSFDSQPLFIEYNSQIIPTVYFLWSFPDILPFLTTHSPVISKLRNGADLMLAGVSLDGEPSLSSYGSLNKGQLCTVNTTSNKCPVAIGHTNISSYDMFMSACQGKAIIIFHIIGDTLWQLGNQSASPQIDWPVHNVNDLGDDNNEINSETVLGASGETYDKENVTQSNLCTENDDIEASIDNIQIKESDNNHEEMSPDDYLLQCFLHALKYSAKDKLLPMPTNLFYANHLRKYCYEDKPLEIKKTSFKKVGAFMKEMNKRGIINLTEANGVQNLVSVNREHDVWHGFRPFLKDNVVEEKPADDSSASVTYCGAPSIEDVWFILDKVLPLFRAMGYKKNDCLTATEIRQLVTQYVKENNLQSETDKSLVTLDGVLSDAVHGKNNTTKSELKWKELVDKLCTHMTKGSRITFPNENPIFTKTKVPLIKIQMFTSGNKKKITRISNLESYRIGEAEFCKLVQHNRACSCGVMNDLVQAQGDQRQYMEKLLIEVYKLPRRFIQVIDDKPGK